MTQKNVVEVEVRKCSRNGHNLEKVELSFCTYLQLVVCSNFMFQYQLPNLFNTITPLTTIRHAHERGKLSGQFSTHAYKLQCGGFLAEMYLANSCDLVASSVGAAGIGHGVTMKPICIKFQDLHKNTDCSIPSIIIWTKLQSTHSS